jgi:hypothetical protein
LCEQQYYTGSTCNLVCCNKLNNSTTTCLFQSSGQSLQNLFSEYAIQISDCPNPEDIDGDTTILVNINWTEVCTIILVHCNKCNNSTTTKWILSAGHALKSSTHGIGLRILDCQNPGNTHGDTAIIVSFIVGEFKMLLLLHNIVSEAPK